MNVMNVFKDLRLRDDLKDFANKCDVKEVVIGKNRDEITVVLTKAVDRQGSVALSRQIKAQLFEDYDIRVEFSFLEEAAKKESTEVEQKIKPVKPIVGAGEKRSRSKLSETAKDGLIYGSAFDEEVSKIVDLEGPVNNVCFRVKVIQTETIPYKKDDSMVIFIMVLSDFTDSIKAKLFLSAKDAEEFQNRLQEAKGQIYILGNVKFDDYERPVQLSMTSIRGIKVCKEPVESVQKRKDEAPEKRVELHCHTKMSDMDGLIDTKELIRCVNEWGHKAVAITDHGVVQSFADAMSAAKPYKDFKVIYGMEAYVIDDLQKAVENPDDRELNTDYTVFDIETTGLRSNADSIIEIGAVRIRNDKIIDRFQSFVNPRRAIPYEIIKLTGIHNEDVQNAPYIEEVLPEFLEYAGNSVIVAHNAGFDMSFVHEACRLQGLTFQPTVLDTVGLARNLLVGLKNVKLDTLAKHFNIELLNHHRADQDAYCTAEILLELLKISEDKGARTLTDLNGIKESTADSLKKLHSYHNIILVKNEIGRVNLYRLVSMSHMKYFFKRPRIPKSELIKHREGLLIGTACAQGELFDALIRGQSDEVLDEIVKFYDYLEIQPLTNNYYLMRGSRQLVRDVEELKELNKKVVELGKKHNKPVVAACDAHFLHPEDEIFRKMLMHGQKFRDFEEDLPIYVRTTEEMLREFSYLGEDLAYEVVVKNTNLIADSIEKISPVRADKCPPVIEHSDKDLRDICYKNAYETYGNPLPKQVEERLEKELSSIIGNGYAVMYIVARKLVKKSNEDGYLVGSRGSVGSSFAATMSEITEVNPLPPHYYCKECHYSDFDSDLVKAYARGAGCDMPDRACPNCGSKLLKDGFDIPFETFLGFKGDKEPDIDLNFSGEYQAIAHKYTEKIFGAGHTFKAGTVGTMADKSARGYVKGYFETKGIIKRECEIDRLSKKLEGIRRSTGQHPGGIVVVPEGEDIMTFTPIQHPANDASTGIITTHFDYHSIDHNLLKLDILGHDDPTMIRMLEDLTGFEAKNISLDDKGVLSLFLSTESLNVKPEDIGGCEVGVLGIPEFGTDFVIQMLIETKPTTFADLVRISGLSHGTMVWTDNAQVLIREGKTDIANAICTRDDIMLYLIEKGLEASKAFEIMEQVRKGKGLKPDQEEYMRENDVPDWYIGSCKKISYMFPKAHAAAYVMMAFRISYYKIYYPLAYYAAYFTVKAEMFDYVSMCIRTESLNETIRSYEEIKKKTATEKETLRILRIVREMYARGIRFEPLDIYKAKAKSFQIIGDKIMPSLTSISGLGETVAGQIEKEAAIKPFYSLEEFKNRTRTDQTTTEKLVELGILDKLPQSAQLSLFDCL